MHQYFALLNHHAVTENLISGNIKLAEDRIPSCLFAFQKEGKGTACVSNAFFYTEAEKPLAQLMKQRRRWINGSYAAWLWIAFQSDWHGTHWLTEVSVFAYCAVSLLQGFLLRMFGPALISVVLFQVLTEIFHQEPARQWIGASSSVLYLLLYAIFMFAHVPRAVLVKDGNDSLDIIDERDLSTVASALHYYNSSTESKEDSDHNSGTSTLCNKKDARAQEKYRSDRGSAYRPLLFRASMVVNVVVMFLLVAYWIILATQTWTVLPASSQAIVVFLPASLIMPIIVTILRFLTTMDVKRDLQSIVILIQSAPFALPLATWFYVWFPAYAAARVSDFTWGNRNTNIGSSSDVAIKNASMGRRVAMCLVISNVGAATYVIAFLPLAPGMVDKFAYATIALISVQWTISIVDILFRAFTRGTKTILHLYKANRVSTPGGSICGGLKKMFTVPKPGGNHAPALGFARFLASVHIVAGHLTAGSKGYTMQWNTNNFGFTWVPWFMMLSGYVLSIARLQSSDPDKLDTWNLFTAKRVKSIYPLYLTGLLTWAAMEAWIENKPFTLGTPLETFASLFLLQAWLPNVTEFVMQPHCWFLSCIIPFWMLHNETYRFSKKWSTKSLWIVLCILSAAPWLFFLIAIPNNEWYQQHSWQGTGTVIDTFVVMLKFHPIFYWPTYRKLFDFNNKDSFQDRSISTSRPFYFTVLSLWHPFCTPIHEVQEESAFFVSNWCHHRIYLSLSYLQLCVS